MCSKVSEWSWALASVIQTMYTIMYLWQKWMSLKPKVYSPLFATTAVSLQHCHSPREKIFPFNILNWSGLKHLWGTLGPFWRNSEVTVWLMNLKVHTLSLCWIFKPSPAQNFTAELLPRDLPDSWYCYILALISETSNGYASWKQCVISVTESDGKQNIMWRISCLCWLLFLNNHLPSWNNIVMLH